MDSKSDHIIATIAEMIGCNRDMASSLYSTIKKHISEEIDEVEENKDSRGRTFLLFGGKGGKYMVMVNKCMTIDAIKDIERNKYIYAVYQ